MFVATEDLERGIEHIQASPKNEGKVELVVARPAIGKREELDRVQLDIKQGLVGDNWAARGYKKMPGGAAHPDMQLNIMNSRAIDLIAQDRKNWKWAGDQFYVDFDLSDENLPPETRLRIGSAVIEVTAEPHLGCKKFKERYGKDATLFVNTKLGKSLNLRGINAKVVESGTVGVGDCISKIG